MKILAILIVFCFLCSCKHLVVVKDCEKVSDSLQKCTLVDED